MCPASGKSTFPGLDIATWRAPTLTGSLLAPLDVIPFTTFHLRLLLYAFSDGLLRGRIFIYASLDEAEWIFGLLVQLSEIWADGELAIGHDEPLNAPEGRGKG